MKNNYSFWYILIALPFFIYLMMRAWQIPITHDEASTFLNFVPHSLAEILTNSHKGATPNNHILNTLGMKFFTWLLPVSAFTTRITALLGGLLYIIATYRMSQMLAIAGNISLLTIVVLLFNPYVAEFFSLARGYGIACGLMLYSIAEGFRYVKYGHQKAFFWALPIGALAVIASFTAIYFYLALVVMLIWVAIERNKISTPAFKLVGYAILVTAILAGLIYSPMQVLTDPNQVQYWSKEGFYSRTIMTLVRDSIVKNTYFSQKAVQTISILSVIFSVLWGIASVVKWARAKYQFAKSPESWLFSLFFGAVVTNILNNYLTNTPFLDHRTAIIFYPLWALGLPICMHWLHEKRPFLWTAFSTIFFVLFVHNFAKSANIRESYEWYYDRDTYTVLEYIKNMHINEGKKEPLSLNFHWIYQPSLEFHTNLTANNYKDYIRLSPWHPGNVLDTSYEYFYVEHPQQEQFDSLYTTVLILENHQRFLLRKKKQ